MICTFRCFCTTLFCIFYFQKASRCHIILVHFSNSKTGELFLKNLSNWFALFDVFAPLYFVYFIFKKPSEGLVWRWFRLDHWRVCLPNGIDLEWQWIALWPWTKIFCSRVGNIDHATFYTFISPTPLSFLFFVDFPFPHSYTYLVSSHYYSGQENLKRTGKKIREIK